VFLAKIVSVVNFTSNTTVFTLSAGLIDSLYVYEGGDLIAVERGGKKHTRNEWRRCETALETSGEDVKLHSKREEKM
jgi:hypothetical protein